MEFRVNHSPVFSTLELNLSLGEFVVAQPNSMLTMTGGISISARAGRQESRGNRWFSGLKSMLGGESFFTAEFRAKSDNQTVTLAPESYGDILVLEVGEGVGFFLTRGSYLANTGESELLTKYGGLKGLMSKKGLFLMHAVGSGQVFCQSYGAVVHRQLDAEESFFVDNRFMVAFSDTVTYKLVKATESVKDSLLSGEGLVNRYTGPGHLYYQTRGKPTGGILSAIVDAAM